MAKVQLINMESDRKWLELDVLDVDGSPKRDGAGKPMRETIVLGSTDDRGIAGCAPPEIVVEGEKWDRLAKHPVVVGMLEARQIAVYPMAG